MRYKDAGPDVRVDIKRVQKPAVTHGQGENCSKCAFRRRHMTMTSILPVTILKIQKFE